MTLPRRRPSAALRDTGVVPILRVKRTGEHLATAIDTLAGAGIRCLEVTTNTPGAFDAVRAARSRLGDEVELGIGTVLSVDAVARAADAGAAFVVCPHTDAAIGAAAARRGLAWYPGALTATEVLTAWSLGATAVKLFPASLGGSRYLKELRGPIDAVPIVPTGGVTIEAIPDFLAAGAIAVGMGGPLLGDALEGGDTAALAGRARRALDAARSADRP